jgi:hypothetical protein
MIFKNRNILMTVVLGLGLALSSCGDGGGPDPVARFQKQLQTQPQYSVILNDMKEEGNFVPTYFHQYRVDIGENQDVHPFEEVSEEIYNKYEPYLGMVLVSKNEKGEVTNTPFPNGYQYVGNPQYGNWRQDQSGNSFWEFYGQYMLMSQVMNWAGMGMGRGHYDDYRSNLQSRQPYFGANKEYGTTGTATKKQKPDFYARRAARKSASSGRFEDKVNRRIGRSKNTFRSRGLSFGK